MLRNGGDGQLADTGLVDGGEHTAGAGDLGVHHQTVDGVHGAGGAAGVVEQLVDFVDGVLLGPGRDLLPQGSVVGHAVLDLQEAGVGLQLGAAHDVAQEAVELVVAGGNDHVAVLGGEGIVRIGGLIPVADALGDTAGGLIDHGDILHGGRHRIHQSHIHLFTQAGLLLVHQSGQNAHRHVQGAQHVAQGGSGAGSGTAGPAAGAHEAAHGLADDIIAGTLAQGAGVAEAGNRAVDDAGVDLFQNIIAQAQLFHGAGAVVLQNHVGLLHQFLEDLLALGLLQVQSDAHLAAVEVGVIHAVAVDERSHFAGIVAALGIFDLDDRGAQVSHQYRRIGACQHAAQIQDDNAVQQAFSVFHNVTLFQKHFL